MRLAADPRRRARLYAAIASVLAVTATAVSLWLSRDNSDVVTPGDYSLLVSFYMYLVVGILLLVRRPENRLGWILTTVGLVPALGRALEEYARQALLEQQGLPGGVAVAWLNQLWWFATLAAIFIFVPLLFPTGRLPSPRWRWLVRLTAAVLFAVVLMEAFGPELNGQNSYAIANPLAVSWVLGAEEGPVGSALFGIIALCMVATIVSLVLRFRRARGVERQQLKWFVFAGVIVIGLPVLELMDVELAGAAVFDPVLSFLPISIGIAVLRYRLYDIDRIISRTVSYALLTATLVALYLAAVTALTTITAPVTRESPVAVAAATLLAAAAFGPARRRIQRGVDRRFNRSRYDAAVTVDRYRTSIRDEVELSSLTTELLAAVGETLQPVRSTLWLRDASGGQA